MNAAADAKTWKENYVTESAFRDVNAVIERASFENLFAPETPQATAANAPGPPTHAVDKSCA